MALSTLGRSALTKDRSIEFEASFRASPDGPLTEEKTRILFEGQAKVNGLALADPAFAQAIGRELTLNMRGSASSRGETMFDTLDLSAPNFDAQYSGLLSGSKIHGHANIVAHDLSRFALLAGGALKGEARIAADLDGAPRYGALSATIDAHATKLATNFPMLDRATGGTLDVTGAARLTPGRRFRLHGSSGERPARDRPAQWGVRARQGGSRRAHRDSADPGPRPAR